jgi:hypothetical protein
VDQAHEQVPDLGAILVFVEQCILAMQNDFFFSSMVNCVLMSTTSISQKVLLRSANNWDSIQAAPNSG